MFIKIFDSNISFKYMFYLLACTLVYLSVGFCVNISGSTYLSVRILTVYLSVLFLCFFFYLAVCLSLYLFLFACFFFFSLFVFLVFLFDQLSIHLPFCSLVCLSVCPVYLLYCSQKQNVKLFNCYLCLKSQKTTLN